MLTAVWELNTMSCAAAAVTRADTYGSLPTDMFATEQFEVVAREQDDKLEKLGVEPVG